MAQDTSKRDYKKEYREYQGTPQQKKLRAIRNKARRDAIRKYGKAKLRGKDVDHIVPLSEGGTNDPSNRRLLSIHINRGRNNKNRKK